MIGNTGKQRSEVGVPSELDNPGAGLQPPAMRPSLSLVLDQIVALTEEQNHLEPFQRALIGRIRDLSGICVSEPDLFEDP